MTIPFWLCISRHGPLLGVTRPCIRPIATMMPGGRTSAARRMEPCLEGGTQGRWLPRRRVSGQLKWDALSTGRTPQSYSTPTHNLLAPRSSFVGREREMPEIRRALCATRLLTLTGVGGSGKTRLALEVARALLEAYPHGVWLVELAPLSEKVLVPKAVAEALDVPERPLEPLADTLAEVLRNRELLLVLDNCEHLLEASARLVDKLLDSCPRLNILATSREALGVEGEVRWPVPPLSVPERQGTPSSGELEAYESVHLFGERARERDPSFSLSPPTPLRWPRSAGCWRAYRLP
jgi:hypothetical protein